MTIAFEPPIPVLRMFSVEKAREFYVDFLAFEIAWEHRFEEGLPIYCEVRRGTLRLHLSEHHGDASPGSTVVLWMTGIDAFQAELLAKRYRYARPGVEPTPWGARMMEIADPFGNRLRFMERGQTIEAAVALPR
jgi:catechol 2,3-dioxygenase-like lactoylglutathione lyase family enzyme